MEFKLKGFPTDLWANIFRIGNGEGPDHQVKGSRYPSLFLNKNRFFTLAITLGDNPNNYKDYGENLLESNTYHIIIEQKMIDGKWMYQFSVNGIMIDSIENTKAMVLDEAKLYLSDPWMTTADVEFTYFRIEY